MPNFKVGGKIDFLYEWAKLRDSENLKLANEVYNAMPHLCQIALAAWLTIEDQIDGEATVERLKNYRQEFYKDKLE